MFDPYAVDISKCDNFYRTFLNVWYGVPCFMTKNVKGNRPINQSKTYGYMRVFMKNSPEKRPEDVTWKGICDYARSSHNFMFCIAMVCFLIENGLYRGEYKDELQVHLSEFHLLLESDSVSSFITDCVKPDGGSTVTINEMLIAFNEYCDQRGWQPLPERVFQKQLPDTMLSIHRAARRNDIKRDGKCQKGYSGMSLTRV